MKKALFIIVVIIGCIGCSTNVNDVDRLGDRDASTELDTDETTSGQNDPSDPSSDSSRASSREQTTTDTYDVNDTASSRSGTNATGEEGPTEVDAGVDGRTDSSDTDTNSSAGTASETESIVSSTASETGESTSSTASEPETESDISSDTAMTSETEPDSGVDDPDAGVETDTDTQSTVPTDTFSVVATDTTSVIATDTAMATDTGPEILCDEIQEPTGGWTETSDGRSIGSIATHHCNEGAALEGSATQACQSNGEWTGSTPTCVTVNQCSPDPCVHGDCVPLSDGYTCSCDGHWDGTHCDVCETNYYGADCQTYCLASTTCSGNGTCTTSGTCSCSGNWTGDSCDECDANYYGSDCQTYCLASATCSGNGTCTTSGTCSCSGNWDGDACDECDTNYYGSDCETYCEASATCNGNGTCTTNGTCSCTGNWDGDACDECDTNYYGSDCETYCLAQTTCSGHGTCTSSGTCSCSGNWDGDSCDECAANYYGSTCQTYCLATTTCSGNGTCTSTGNCSCTGNWDGPNCDACTANYYGSNCETYCNASTTCSGHGTCTASGTCSCSGNWDGASCNACAANYYGDNCDTYCSASTTCNGRGTCTTDGTCQCTGNWDGPDCESCAPGYVRVNNTCAPYCDHRSCWEVPPTEQTHCSNEAGDAITCPSFPCPNDGSSAYCGQDSQYPGNDRTYTAQTGSSETVIVDSLTGLVWLDIPERNLTWSDAVEYCSQIANTWCLGDICSGWRAPAISELMGIVHYDTSSTLDHDVFSSGNLYTTWAAEERLDNSDNAWILYFPSGWSGSDPKSDNSNAARCVNDNNAVPTEHAAERYDTSESNGDILVHDQATGLMWQYEIGEEPWRDIFSYCEGSNYGGYSDWRVPDINELISIANHNRTADESSSDFPDMPNCADEPWTCTFWSSTTRAATLTSAWVARFSDGSTAFENKTTARSIRCVRDE